MAMSKRMWESQQERRRQERMRKLRLRRNCTLVVALVIIAIVIVIGIIKNSEKDTNNINTDITNSRAEGEAVTTEVPSSSPIPSVTQNPDIKLSDTYYKNAVFIGDALADGIGMYSILPECSVYAKVGLAVKNVYSTAADNDTIAIIDQLKSKKYAKVFLAFGESELMSGNSSDFQKDYEELIATVKKYQTSARIYLMAIPPVSESASAKYGITQNRIKSFNSAIKQLASSMNVYYSDCYSGIVEKNGFLAEGVSLDGINLDRATYLKMLDYISEHSFIPGDDEDEYEDRTDEELEEEKTSDDESSDEDVVSDEDVDRKKSSSSDKSSDEDNGSGNTEKSTPKPTINVLKDSHINNSSKNSE